MSVFWDRLAVFRRPLFLLLCQEMDCRLLDFRFSQCLPPAYFFFFPIGLRFDPEERGIAVLRNVGAQYKTTQPNMLEYSILQISVYSACVG